MIRSLRALQIAVVLIEGFLFYLPYTSLTDANFEWLYFAEISIPALVFFAILEYARSRIEPGYVLSAFSIIVGILIAIPVGLFCTFFLIAVLVTIAN